MRQEILTGVERRRRWSREDKLRILGEVGIEGMSVAAVARRHDVTRQHLYQWRRELRRNHLAVTGHPALVPVEVCDHPDPATASPAVDRAVDDQRVEIVLCNGRTIRTSAALPDGVLTRLIRLTEAA